MKDVAETREAHGAAEACRVSPEAWGGTLSAAPVLDRLVSQSTPVHIRRWRGVAPEIDQVALDQHFISVHLGGPKQLSRRGEGASLVREATNGSHSVVPAGAAFQWNTRGPVDFAHIYISPSVLDRVVIEAFDRDPSKVALQEDLAADDDLVRCIVKALLDELVHAEEQRSYLEELVQLLLCHVLRLHSDARSPGHHAKHALAPARLKRALDFIESHLEAPIGVSEIATASGVSPYHFSRAFRQATGTPPYAYLLDRRMKRAKDLLGDCDTSLSSVAQQSGFASLSQFSRTFRRDVGVTPTQFRNSRCL